MQTKRWKGRPRYCVDGADEWGAAGREDAEKSGRRWLDFQWIVSEEEIRTMYSYVDWIGMVGYVGGGGSMLLLGINTGAIK